MTIMAWWCHISRYKNRDVMKCQTCGCDVTGADEYYTRYPSRPVPNRPVRCMRCGPDGGIVFGQSVSSSIAPHVGPLRKVRKKVRL